MSTEPGIIREFVDSTDSCEGVVLVVEKFVGGRLDVVRGDGVDARKCFGGCHATAIVQERAPDFFGNVVVSIEIAEHGGLE